MRATSRPKKKGVWGFSGSLKEESVKRQEFWRVARNIGQRASDKKKKKREKRGWVRATICHGASSLCMCGACSVLRVVHPCYDARSPFFSIQLCGSCSFDFYPKRFFTFDRIHRTYETGRKSSIAIDLASPRNRQIEFSDRNERKIGKRIYIYIYIYRSFEQIIFFFRMKSLSRFFAFLRELGS